MMRKEDIPNQAIDYFLEHVVRKVATGRPAEAVRRAAIARGFICPRTRSSRGSGFLVLQAGTNTLGDVLVLGARIPPCAVRNGAPAPGVDWREDLLLPQWDHSEFASEFARTHDDHERDHDYVDEGWLRDEERLWVELHQITYYGGGFAPRDGLQPLPHPARLLRRSVGFRFECDKALDVARTILSIPYLGSPGMLPLMLFRGHGFPGDHPTPLYILDPEIALFVRLLPHLGLRPHMSCSGHRYETDGDADSLRLYVSFEPKEDDDRFIRLRDEERVFGDELACPPEAVHSCSMLGPGVHTSLDAWRRCDRVGARLVDRWWPRATDEVSGWKPRACAPAT